MSPHIYALYPGAFDYESNFISIRLTRAHRYVRAWQRILDLQEQNPTTGDKDG